jgi:flavin-dependent dehydrogenase
MPPADPHYDVAIVGASIAGCTAAIFYSRHGLRVALIERNPDPNAYKKICTHFIQSSATPTIQRLGLAGPLEQAGAVRNGVEIWTQWGWIRIPDTPENPRPYGYSITRRKLDPLLRGIAANAPGVDFFPGVSACGLIEENRRIRGVRLEGARQGSTRLRASLVVGADGRNSLVGRLARLPQKVKPNNRFSYFAYFRDLPLVSGAHAQMWILEPDVAYAFPNEDGLTLLAAMPHRDRLPEFKRDLPGAFYRFFRALPDGPDLSSAKQVSEFLGMLDMPNASRRAAGRGVALIGDAALASDPLWGVGCGWAFQSAEWLVDRTAEALQTRNPARIDRALERYRKAHHAALAGHEYVVSDFSARKHWNLIERLFLPAAAHDPVIARHFEAFGSRRVGLKKFLDPRAILRAVRVNLTQRSAGAPPS